MHQSTITVPTQGRGFYNITRDVQAQLNGTSTGLCHVFIQHTSASLVITENADPDVLVDLETWISGAVTDGDRRFLHRAEGPDDMSAHIRSLLTQTSLTLPITHGRLALGTWQGIFVWEHRTSPHTRNVLVTTS
jgi:secondary thiamine-phosphate synthase enzyme